MSAQGLKELLGSMSLKEQTREEDIANAIKTYLYHSGNDLKRFLLTVMCLNCLPVSRGRHRASFDQVSEFDGGRIVAYRDCGLSSREIGQRVERNQATVMWICHRWMQEETTCRRSRLYPLFVPLPVITGEL
ncbi:transposable element Tcb1 transposase [Trichonephila clavipes]|uniref:Transposable element Tcb1 transposase n=1 Tax=Trichonephila clavipes TaxID=2585209 RepID=A0A8X6V1Q2_TRICX|nr:transposable element Tcb1 transposase [Trichonephila clavipes]